MPFGWQAIWEDKCHEKGHVISRWGQVRLQRWNGLHGKLDADVPFDVIRASHLLYQSPQVQSSAW